MRDHPLESILCDIKSGVSRRSQVSNFYGFTSFVSQIEPKTIKEAIIDEYYEQSRTLYNRDLSIGSRITVNKIKDPPPPINGMFLQNNIMQQSRTLCYRLLLPSKKMSPPLLGTTSNCPPSTLHRPDHILQLR
jgi:hypothetical protein